MALTNPFVLPSGFVLAPVSELPERVQREIGSQDGEFALSRSNSRVPSKLIDTEGAALVNEFQRPSTIAAAVARFSRGKSVEAEALLEAALPMLQSLIAAGLLVPADSPEAAAISPSLAAETNLHGWDILRCVQVLDDTEIYQMRGPDGRFAALKICRTGFPAAGRAIEREARILAKLDSTVTPRLFAAGEWRSRAYLITEWLQGLDAQTVCAQLRHTNQGEPRRNLLAVSGAILGAYARLHEQGVIHGDVHPRNVLIDRRHGAKILDFGSARMVTDENERGPASRAGISFFFEPEYAAAARAGTPSPNTSLTGEQYSVAALLYLLLTGSHYLDFVVEKSIMLRQIAEDAMVPFFRRGAEPWPSVERLLEKALSKTASDRFWSLAEFLQAWEAAGIPPPAPADGDNPTLKLHRVSDELRANSAIGGALTSDGPLPPPSTSINYGSAGLAYALYRIACASDDAELFAQADLWSSKAANEIGEPNAFYSDILGITPGAVGSVSLYHGPAGVYAVQALIAHARGDGVTHDAATRAFVEICRQPCDALDLTFGCAGALLGCALLLEKADDARVRIAGNDLFNGLCRSVNELSPVSEPSELRTLGMAHGWSGVLYATLTWCIVAGEPLPHALRLRLGELARCAQPAGRGLQWSSSSGHELPDSLPSSWCNGSGGQVFLWTQAHRATRDQRYLELAEGAAWNVYEKIYPHPNLCCGTAGQAYALLNFYRHCGDRIWLQRARERAESAALASASRLARRRAEPLEWRSGSLYKGDAGLAVLAVDLERPDEARMPMFECDS